MNILGLLIFTALLIFLIWFSVRLLIHLIRVFDWIAGDILRAVRVFTTAAGKLFGFVFERFEDDEPVPQAEDRAGKIRESEPAADEPVDLQWAGNALFFVLNLIFKSVFFIYDNITRIPGALRAPFPLHFSVFYLKAVLIFLPAVVVFRIPDIYGTGPLLAAVRRLAAGYPLCIAAIYILRIMFALDVEKFFRAEAAFFSGREYAVAARRWKRASFLCLPLLLTGLLFCFPLENIWIRVLLMGVFYSAAHLTTPGRSGGAVSARRAAVSGLIMAAFLFFALASLRTGGRYELIFFSILLLLVLIAFAMILKTWAVLKRERAGIGEQVPRLFVFGSWINFAIVPLVKSFVVLISVYFILMDFTIHAAAFAAKAAVFAVLALLWFRVGRRLPDYLKPGLFAAYVVFMWSSIIFVQGYNRIPPSDGVCDSLAGSGNVSAVWLLKNNRAVKSLSGTLQYDSIQDFDENAVFVSFKNLNGRGAVGRIDPAAGSLEAALVTENDESPGSMFYPERFCIDKRNKKVYVTTKCTGNFQLLAMDYAGGGLSLARRVRFPDFETTNCEVDTRTGDVYVIFLGPPASHVMLVDGETYETERDFRFGALGYADYFVLDEKRDRIIVPSLDPTRLFRIHVVENPAGAYSISGRTVAWRLKLPDGVGVNVPLPTLGIAFNESADRFYFSCPFLGLVLEADGSDFHVLRTMYTGRFPRKIAYNQKRGKLLVANYAGGTVVEIDVEDWKITATHRVGRMVRGINVDSETGRSFAVTGCGVFEILP